MEKKKFLSIGGLLLCTLFWSINVALARSYTSEIPPLILSLIRWCGAFMILLPFTYKDLKPVLDYFYRNPFQLLILSLFSITLYNTLQYFASVTTQSININLMITLNPPITILLALIINRVRYTLRGTIGMLLALLGTVNILVQGEWSNLFKVNFVPGDLIMLVAVICWGIYSVMLNKYSIKLKPLPLYTAIIFMGTLFLLIIHFIVGDESNYSFKVDHLPIYIYLWIFPSILSNIFWFQGVKEIGASSASLFLYTMPVYGTIIGIYILGESFRQFHLIGGLFILVGFILNFINGNSWKRFFSKK